MTDRIDPESPGELLNTAIYIYRLLILKKFPGISEETILDVDKLVIPIIGFEIAQAIDRLVRYSGSLVLASEMMAAERDAAK